MTKPMNAKERRQTAKAIDEMVGVFEDPIIVMDPGWALDPTQTTSAPQAQSEEASGR